MSSIDDINYAYKTPNTAESITDDTSDPVTDERIDGQPKSDSPRAGRTSWDKRTFARNGSGHEGIDGSHHRAGATITALGYVRVSTDEQSASGAGLAAQRAAVQAEVERRGWVLADIVEDAGFSGRDLRRPGIRSVLADLRSGRASALIVAKVDRLSRSMVDFTALMDRSSREGWALVALDLGVDTSTPSGEAMVNVMATFSQFERRLIGQRTKEALAVKRAQGVRLGRPPVLSNAVVERMCQERAAGATLRAIADGLDRDGIPTAQGGRRWHAATVRDVIRASERRMSSQARATGPRPQRVRVLR